MGLWSIGFVVVANGNGGLLARAPAPEAVEADEADQDPGDLEDQRGAVEMAKVAAREAIVAGVRAVGYRHVTRDLAGFRSEATGDGDALIELTMEGLD